VSGARLRVVLVEDNDAYRETLEFLLGRSDELDVVGAVATGAEAPDACLEHDADVAVIDLRLPDLNGTEAAAAVRERSPHTSVVFLSASAGPGDSGTPPSSGWPLVRKDAGIDALVTAIRESRGSA
jgi:two-component system, NarL family, response regulator DesR